MGLTLSTDAPVHAAIVLLKAMQRNDQIQPWQQYNLEFHFSQIRCNAGAVKEYTGIVETMHAEAVVKSLGWHTKHALVRGVGSGGIPPKDVIASACFFRCHTAKIGPTVAGLFCCLCLMGGS